MPDRALPAPDKRGYQTHNAAIINAALLRAVDVAFPNIKNTRSGANRMLDNGFEQQFSIKEEYQ
jgi:hypothetical protein